jgi:hypothetical protein
LRENLPTGVVVPEFLGPLRKLAGRRICGRKNGCGQTVCVNEGYLQLRREPFIPKRCFAAAVMTGENESSGFVLTGDRLRKKFG